MGATLHEDFAMNFLTALRSIWSKQSATYEVEENEVDLFPALAQITIRWLAAMAREWLRDDDRGLVVRGNIRDGDARIQPGDAFRDRNTVCLREALNKIVHAEPTWVSVRDGEMILCWTFTPPYDSDKSPYSAYFFADSLLAGVRRALYSETSRQSQVSELERQISTDPAFSGLLPG